MPENHTILAPGKLYKTNYDLQFYFGLPQGSPDNVEFYFLYSEERNQKFGMVPEDSILFLYQADYYPSKGTATLFLWGNKIIWRWEHYWNSLGRGLCLIS